MAPEQWIVPLEGHVFDAENLPLWLAGWDVNAVCAA
jgi:hypothetical protein